MRLQSPIRRRQGPPRLTSGDRALVSVACIVVALVASILWLPDSAVEAVRHLEEAVRVSGQDVLGKMRPVPGAPAYRQIHSRHLRQLEAALRVAHAP